jgi:hypothetical protein
VGKKRKRKGKLNETTSADPDDHGENDVFNLGDVDAAGSSVDPEYDSDTQSPDAKINGEGCLIPIPTASIRAVSSW